jgi:adenylosuccinate synthase
VPTLERSEPVYQPFAGWSEDISEVSSWQELPAAARDYLHFVSQHLGVPIRIVSTGPKREQTVLVEAGAVMA